MSKRLLKCKVKAEKLMIEVFDNKGNPKTYKTKDGAGNVIDKTEQQMLRKGAEVALPEDRIPGLGNAVELILAPVAVSEVDVDGTDADVPDVKDATVADKIPKK